MNKVTMMAAVAALSVSAGAYAQSNNTLATPSVVSPAAATNSGYGTPGAGNSDSGAGASNASMQNGGNAGSTTPAVPAAGVNNTLARPSVKSPVAQ